MTIYEYAQRVMEAAGVEPRISFEGGKMYADAERFESYPCPLSSGDAFLALWDALVARNYSVTVSHKAYGSAAVCVHAEGALARWQFHADRAVALVEAAGRALGVTR